MRVTGFSFLLLAVQGSLARLTGRAQILSEIDNLKTEYDYVIVGGGASGLTVANRLSERGDASVLVIEYGPLDTLQPAVLVPGLPPPFEYQRNYNSVPQPGLGNRVQKVYTAGVVGGGTVINGMFFNRGSAAEYDDWEKLGNPGWGWSGLLPYFKKSENFTPAPPEIAAQFPISPDLEPHGTDGPVQSSFPNYAFPALQSFFSAWKSAGIPSNPQPNDGRALGAIYSPLTLNAANQSRCSAATAYYRGQVKKDNAYHLLTMTSVTKILIDSKNKATGVEFKKRNGTSLPISITATKEVILAAGAVRTPGLLQLSGIGPKKLLESLKIKVRVDLPGVGYNFQDQPTYFASVSYDASKYPSPSPLDSMSDKQLASNQLAQYYNNRTGPYTQVYFSGTTVAFLTLKQIAENYKSIIGNAKKVDLAKALPAGADTTILSGYKKQQERILEAFAGDDSAAHESAASGGTTVPLVVVRPLSRGSILINSTDPLADPVIDYGTFQHRLDVDVGIAMIRKFRDFATAPEWKKIGLKETAPGVSVQTEAQIETVLRNSSQSTWSHPVGTCAMLPKADGGVVDSDLRVYGVTNLRVVDASMMPMIPAGHTTSTVYAVAEKAAALILKGSSDTKSNK